MVLLSGGTEANNLAIFGAMAATERRHAITTTIEHPAVLNPCAELQRRGCEVTYSKSAFFRYRRSRRSRRAIRSDTAIVSVAHVNNEIGTIQPIAELSSIAHSVGAVMHSDGVQACGRIPVDIRELGVDLYSISGHKMYAPKGPSVGLREEGHKTDLSDVRRSSRAGTSCRHRERRWSCRARSGGGICVDAPAQRRGENCRASGSPEQELCRIPNVKVNGDQTSRIPGTTNICFEGIEGEPLVISLDLKGFAVSSGSACSSGAVTPSHVLTAIGLSAAQAKSSVRFSLGRTNTAEQVDALIDVVCSWSNTSARSRRLIRSNRRLITRRAVNTNRRAELLQPPIVTDCTVK